MSNIRRAFFVLDPSTQNPIIEAYEDDSANRGNKPILQELTGWGSTTVTTRSVPDLFDTRHFRRGKTIAPRAVEATIVFRDDSQRKTLRALQNRAGSRTLLPIARVTYDELAMDEGTRIWVLGHLIGVTVVDVLDSLHFRVRLSFHIPSNHQNHNPDLGVARSPEWVYIRQQDHTEVLFAYGGAPGGSQSVVQYRFDDEDTWHTFSQAEPDTALRIGIPEEYQGTRIHMRARTVAPWARSVWNERTVHLLNPPAPPHLPPVITSATEVDGGASFTYMPVMNATGYQSQYRINEGSWIIVSTAPLIPYVVHAEPDDVVEFRVRATNPAGESAWSVAQVVMEPEPVTRETFAQMSNYPHFANKPSQSRVDEFIDVRYANENVFAVVSFWLNNATYLAVWVGRNASFISIENGVVSTDGEIMQTTSYTVNQGVNTTVLSNFVLHEYWVRPE